MNTKLAVVVIAGGSFLGGLVADLLLRGDPALAQSPPLPPVPLAIGSDVEKASTYPLADRFQAVIKQMSPAVVAVDAVKPPSSDPTSKGKAVEESGSGVLVKFRGVKGVVAVTNNHVVGSAEPAKVYVTWRTVESFDHRDLGRPGVGHFTSARRRSLPVSVSGDTTKSGEDSGCSPSGVHSDLIRR